MQSLQAAPSSDGIDETSAEEAQIKKRPSIDEMRDLVGLDPIEASSQEVITTADSSDLHDDSLIDDGDFVEETELATKRKLWQQGWPKFAIVAIPMGSVCILVAFLLSAIGGMELANEDGNKGEVAVIEGTGETATQQHHEAEIARLKTANALGNQASILDSQPTRRTEIRPTTQPAAVSVREPQQPNQQPEQAAEPQPVPQPPTPPRTRPIAVSRAPITPAPRLPARRAASTPTPAPQTFRPQLVQAQPIVRPVPVDPFAQWERLAAVGSYGQVSDSVNSSLDLLPAAQPTEQPAELASASSSAAIPILVSNVGIQPNVGLQETAVAREDGPPLPRVMQDEYRNKAYSGKVSAEKSALGVQQDIGLHEDIGLQVADTDRDSSPPLPRVMQGEYRNKDGDEKAIAEKSAYENSTYEKAQPIQDEAVSIQSLGLEPATLEVSDWTQEEAIVESFEITQATEAVSIQSLGLEPTALQVQETSDWTQEEATEAVSIQSLELEPTALQVEEVSDWTQEEAAIESFEITQAAEVASIQSLGPEPTALQVLEVSDWTQEGAAIESFEITQATEVAQQDSYESGVSYIMRNAQPTPGPEFTRRETVILPGINARGAITTPVAWAQDIQSTAGSIELTEDLISNGSVIMPAGTQLTVALSEMSASGMMRLIVTSIILPEAGYEHMQIPAEAISIQGAGGRVLMAKDVSGVDGELRRLDRNQALLGALGTVGSVLNRPSSSINTVGVGGAASSTTYGSPNIIGAILEGSANTMIAGQAARNQQRAAELQQRPAVWVLEQGTEIEVFISEAVIIGK